MSEVNKLDNKKCPFDLDQYQMKIDNLAPVGSTPWALIQVYSGNMAHRKDWSFPDEYIRLTTKSDDGAIHIEKRDKYGTERWQPTPGDLMACDWNLLIKPKPIDCMLEFDLTLGTSSYFNGSAQDWGYMTDKGDLATDESTFGTLTTIKNNTVIANIFMFYWEESVNDSSRTSLRLKVSSAQDNYNNMLNLIKKSLSITVDGVNYNVGEPSPSLFDENDNDYWYTAFYQSDEARKLGTILKQSGQTKRFCLNWK
ncbi:Thoeris anti-defense Tad2 family protein [Xenorhabdus cabanillasii]|uniref:Uncharacterized protein n=1 Tax=Xenorhabdus cabanillasii JM26 TaxID=1427517 RepID=W1JCI4_9GAMM|nr:MW1434 family type I TA system toxin [Xenorhabdus cabanillasii]PHM79348.1 hypothetical protein Xcab_00144 [Xenorhabdus cabanillasii JM26]CDL87866.1 conserved hypothetical protein [Xenorhabdus cabanillasii JM26]